MDIVYNINMSIPSNAIDMDTRLLHPSIIKGFEERGFKQNKCSFYYADCCVYASNIDGTTCRAIID